MDELPKNYLPKEAEPKWQKYWEENDIYGFDLSSKKPVFSLDTPPPTVSGKMHIGHAFSYSQQDFVARFHRMKQENVFYPFGTDDNGLPTERLVEKTKNVKSTRMDRAEFRELCYKTIKELKPEFVRPWKELAISCDFKNSYSTIDLHCQKTSQLSFIDLHEKGRIFNAETPVSWCPSCQTAIAQAEFENVEMTSHFNDIIFKSGGKDLVISTTRPELLPACVALFTNPEDARYSSLVGKFATVPLFNYEVPIMADSSVNTEKGTGLMMVCTFGDKEDIEKWYKYNLPLRIAISKDGLMNELAGKYKGMKLKEARKTIIEDLKSENLLIKQKDITHPVNVHERCGTEIEYLKTKQWYIKVLDKKEELIEAGNKINWYPKHMQSRYTHWVQNLNWNWCISRQRHFGVPFPVWFCKKCGEVKVANRSQLPVDPLKDKPLGKCHCGADEFVPEYDVMDTWMTSSNSPQITLDWAEENSKMQKMFPMSLRPQAHDIIRTWAFYTITKGIFNNNSVPWKNIMISGHALDPRGEKMSKSKGNVVDPIETMKKYNADSLRFWAAGSKLGEDMPYQEKDLVTGHKFINKLWNASKFCLMHLDDYKYGTGSASEAIDKWVLSKLSKVVKNSTESFEQYEYAKTKQEVENFFWHTFCDYYLEIVKDRLYNADKRGEEARLSAQHTLVTALDTILKLMAPIMPHITEEVYHLYFAEKQKMKSIHISEWPSVDLIDEESGQIGDLFVNVLEQARRVKSERNVSLKEPIKNIIIAGKITEEQFEQIKLDLIAVTHAQNIFYKQLAKDSAIDFEADVQI